MLVTWTITASANWNWTAESDISFEGEGWTYADSASVVRITDPEDWTNYTTLTDTQTRTATFYTSTLSEVETSIKTTTTSFDEGAFIFALTTSASVNTNNGQIVVFSLPTTQTLTTQSATISTVLSTQSAGTYLVPFPPINRAIFADPTRGWNVGHWSDYAPTVVAWSSALGYTHPLAQSSNTATSLPSAASLAFSGQITLLPASGQYNLQNFTTDGLRGPDVGPTSEIYQSEAITWTEQNYAQSELTVAAEGLWQITKSTQTVVQQVATTITYSDIFEKIRFFQSVDTGPHGLTPSSFPSWWTSTLTTAATYVNVTATQTGKSTTTKLTSSSYSSVNYVRTGLSAQLPLEKYLLANKKRGELQFGKYSHFYTQNAGAALNTTQEGRAVISDAGQSFPIPLQSFSTVLLQRGVTAPMPFQTRSSTSSNSTTSWSLGFTALSITTIFSNSTTRRSTTSSYDLSAGGPTIWASSSQSVEATSFTAAGGHYATNSVFVGGGLFTATASEGEFTGSVVSSVGTNASAFQPLPHFVPVLGEPSAATFAPAIQTVAGGVLNLGRIGWPLTA